MKILLKVFPIADINDSTQEFELELDNGKLGEVLEWLKQTLGIDPHSGVLMILCNGQSLDLLKEYDLSANDTLWAMPMLAGG